MNALPQSPDLDQRMTLEGASATLAGMFMHLTQGRIQALVHGWLPVVTALAVFAAICGWVSAPAVAQEGDALRFFQQNPGRTLLRSSPSQRLAPRAPERARIVRPRDFEEGELRTPRRAAPVIRIPSAPPPPVVAEKPNVPPSFFVQVMGDSLGELMSAGLTEQLAEKPEIAVVRNTRSSSGLVRQDYHDWPKVLKDLIDRKERMDVVVMMVGSNDRQTIRDETGTHEFRSEGWSAAYARRIDALISTAREGGVKLVWVGVPVMQGQRFAADMLFVNTLAKERVTRANVPYVDLWEGFANDQGQYASIGPSVIGELVRLRTSDGIHFTKAGGRKAGFFVAKEIDGELTRRRSDPAVASLILPPPGTAPGSGEAPSIVLPELTQPFAGAIVQRPAAGAVVALTVPPVSVGAVLLSRRIQPQSNEMQILVEQTLGYGRPTVAKPGRADDFRWPRQ
jgi:uncharacterized protein